MELATMLIWTLRIVLPIILFCIYFKFQSSKDEQYAGPTGQCYSRGRLMAHRQALAPDATVPPGILDVALKDQTQAPELFTGTPSSRVVRTPSGRSAGGPPRVRKERSEGEGRKPKRQPEGSVLASVGEVEEGRAEVVQQAEAKMHLESLLNYVAFNRKEQQRNFVVDEASGPPPPPPKPKASASVLGDGAPAVSEEAVRKANSEAQMVLQGAMRFKRAEVAKTLYKQLTDSQVEISERTFTLMIESSVLACDLKSASDLLMKMESSGCCPEADLLDKVMDLYSTQKSRREQERQYIVHSPLEAVCGVPSQGMGMGMDAPVEEFMRAKLSSAAPEFVPRFGMEGAEASALHAAAAMSAEEAAPAAEAAAEALLGALAAAAGGVGVEHAAAPMPVTAAVAAAAEGLTPLTAQRTRLVASAKPFEPQFNATFDQYMYVWTVDPNAGGETFGGGHGQGKGDGWRGGKDGVKKTRSKGAEQETEPATASVEGKKHGGFKQAAGGKTAWKVKESAQK
mmetsp:Transcript_168132/g.540033  ORF Transcript_168132/g.540033 Transcript_168132/m.540033 type:complete len:512 (+) Transcript_168132:173-1708(+)|eukprot:CAMPEP_0203868312 /NCGR_PEP_ID=MMETSP0359-20131031/17035_1 /ASSEMBLY_ACC=CAM_ASM_000338 /TAXON_ID=268821 /ORGANISM="Scrippsiella Hangoei, Strain SHTV-5" /LENGTH=511 /DNA_ID=CAMNT_0050786705 /DNA_START=161 /DNA_END=1696 /DNA_ORIENTATION=-